MSSVNKRIVLIGGGGHCRSVIDSLKNSKKYEGIVATDKTLPVGSKICGVEVVGSDDVLHRLYSNAYTYAAITVGFVKTSATRRQILYDVAGVGFEFPVISDPSSILADRVHLERGVYIGKRGVINTESRIGEFSIINTGAIVEHDCSIGRFCHVAVGAVVCGGAEIGDDVLVGANATIIQGVKIGNRSVIGAGSVVLADVPDDTTVVGVWKGFRILGGGKKIPIDQAYGSRLTGGAVGGAA